MSLAHFSLRLFSRWCVLRIACTFWIVLYQILFREYLLPGSGSLLRALGDAPGEAATGMKSRFMFSLPTQAGF